MDLLKDSERKNVQDQYERHAYPALPLLAFPSAPAAHPVAFELGQYLRTGRFVEHTSATRILVAGSGTFEPIVVARAHPRAQVVAVDLSSSSLRELRVRSLLNGVWRRLECVQADLHEDLSQRLGTFDYVICTGVIHHSSTPELLLERLHSLLKTSGVLRLMTYAAESRRLIYELQEFFKLSQTKPKLRACRQALAALPETHPLRDAFVTYSDIQTQAGLIDGFFHACDRPIEVDRLRSLTERVGFALLGFGHAWHSQPGGFEKQFTDARFKQSDPWEKLAAIDELGELAVNPVCWFARTLAPVRIGLPSQTKLNPALALGSADNEILAPLLPAGEELMAKINRDQIASLQEELAVIGGLKIGCDGALPRALAQNRVEPRPTQAKKKSEARSADQAAQARLIAILKRGPARQNAELAVVSKATFSKDMFTNHGLRFLVPSPLRFRMLQMAQKALCRTSIPPAEATEGLIKALEPRVDRQGRILAWLSTGDLLRDLARLDADAPRLALEAGVEPPTDEQWLSVMSADKLTALKIHLAIEGGTRWLVLSELAFLADKRL